MTVKDVLAALALPPDATVDQRVPKKLLVENGAPTATDKRQINEGIEELHWLAALKPNTIAVPEYKDAVREYLEIAVLTLHLRSQAKMERLLELVHRAVPYPVLLVSEQAEALTLSTAHKRWSQGEAGKVVLDDTISACDLTPHQSLPAFLDSISLARQPRGNMYQLYQGWTNCLQALEAARITNTYLLPTNDEAAQARKSALIECEKLSQLIKSYRVQAQKEKQINRRIELNLEIRRLEAALTEALEQL